MDSTLPNSDSDQNQEQQRQNQQQESRDVSPSMVLTEEETETILSWRAMQRKTKMIKLSSGKKKKKTKGTDDYGSIKLFRYHSVWVCPPMIKITVNECIQFLRQHNHWDDPDDSSLRAVTYPVECTRFISRHLAEADACVEDAEKRVKSKRGKRHVRFLLDRMARITERICGVRLVRSGFTLNGLLAVMKDRPLRPLELKVSMSEESQDAARVRWLSVMLGAGSQAYKAVKRTMRRTWKTELNVFRLISIYIRSKHSKSN